MAYSLAPWLNVRGGEDVVAFYRKAFGAEEVYRHDEESGGMACRVSVRGAELWVSAEAPLAAIVREPPGGGTVRMILTVPHPAEIFAQALAAGATEVFPVGEGHGRLPGRLADPFGLHREIGHPL